MRTPKILGKEGETHTHKKKKKQGIPCKRPCEPLKSLRKKGKHTHTKKKTRKFLARKKTRNSKKNNERGRSGYKIDMGKELICNNFGAEGTMEEHHYLQETTNHAFGKPCLSSRDTRHFRPFRRFTGFEQQNPCFFS